MAFNPIPEYRITPKNIDIYKFHRHPDKYVTRPPYQRKNVWSKDKKKKLMDSLLRRYYIPKLVIREVRISDNKTIYEVVDGQQRITTVQSFFNNEFKLPESLNDIHSELGNKYHKDLPLELREYIDELIFDIDIITDIENPKNSEHQKVATEIFWRLQQGEALNFMEVAHAKLSSLSRNIVVKYSDDISFDYDNYIPIESNKDKHPFFNLLNKDNKRMEHLKLFTRFLIIEKEKGYTGLKDSSVTDFINNYVQTDGIGNYSLEGEVFVKNSLSVLNLIYDIFKDDPMLSKINSQIKELSVEYFIISFYLLIRHLKKHYVIGDSEKLSIREYFYEFYKRWWHNDSTDLDIMDFSNNRQQSVKNLEIRDRIFRQLFFEFLKNNKKEFILKDENRAFNESQRIEIYRRDKGLCQECILEEKNEKEATVSWDNYQADHIFPHTKGGPTNIENGQVLCEYHNKKKSDKII